MFRKPLPCNLLAFIGAASLVPGIAHAGSLQLLAGFGNAHGGEAAQGDLVAGRGGRLFGTTTAGGAYGTGTVFELIPPSAGHYTWRKQTIYSFNGNATGYGPNGGPLLVDKKGDLYGVITLDLNGAGQVFKLSRPTGGAAGWRFSTLYSFTGKADGAGPNMGLIMDSAGNLYGTTQGGGTNNHGVVYDLSPPAPGKTVWTQQVIYAFTTLFDGGDSFTGVVADKSGNLIGTTSNGGYIDNAQCQVGCGTIFRLIPPGPGQYIWKKQTLHQFTGGADGAEPESGVILDRNGVIYGTTAYGGVPGACASQEGCGTVFSLAPSGASFVETILHAFGTAPDGAFPVGQPVLDASGALLGTTALGGVSGQGTIYRLTPGGPPWSEAVLFDFANTTVSQPWSSLLPNNSGGYYGTTSNGPAGSTCYGCGAAFSFTP